MIAKTVDASSRERRHGIMALLRKTGRVWSEHKVLQLSAALAYYSIFSMAPLLVIAMALAGEFFGAAAVRGRVYVELKSAMGSSVASMIQSMIESAYQPGKSVWAAVIGFVILLVGASGVFGQLKDALDTLWSAPRQSSSGIVALLRGQMMSFSMVLVIGFLMLTSLLLNAVVAATWDLVAIYLPFSQFILAILAVLLSLSVIGSLFAFIFKWLPNVPVHWRDAWIGGAVTAALFEIGKFVLALYLGRAGASSSYGAAGAVVLILMWIYYSSVILLTGACFTRAYAELRRGDSPT